MIILTQERKIKSLNKIIFDHTKEGKEEIENLISEFHDLFPLGNDPAPSTDLTQHKIRTKNNASVNTIMGQSVFG